MKQQLPVFLRNRCTEDAYGRWLRRRASAHVRRDRKRGFAKSTVATYKTAIHEAVVASGGRDAYTGKPLRWDLISRYDNAASKAGRTKYKHKFGDLPSVDHVGGGGERPRFRICAWRTNDAKHDLPYEDFVALCHDVIAHCRRGHAHGASVRGSKAKSAGRP
jgi:hypothetical protein